MPLLLAILLLGRQPQKIEAFKCMLYYIALLALPLLVLLLRLNRRVALLMATPSFFILLPFLAKTPAFVLHLWLPKAHVEASTSGSILLAARVMKLGTFGLLLSGGPPAVYRNMLYTAICAGVLLTMAPLLRNTDLKRLVAYSRVLHIAGSILGWCFGTTRALNGVLFANVAHTILRPVIFYGVGIFYVSARSRDRTYLRGVFRYSVAGVAIILVFALNAGIPPGILSGAELWILYGIRLEPSALFFIRCRVFVRGVWSLLLAGNQGRMGFACTFGRPVILLFPIYTRFSPLILLV